MLVERARRYEDAIEAVFAEARTRPLVTSLMIEGMPVLGYALVLAHRAGMTDSELSQRLASGGLESMAERAKASGDENERFAALWILKWLDEPVSAERAHNTLVVESARSL